MEKRTLAMAFYLGLGFLSALMVIGHTYAEADYLRRACEADSLANAVDTEPAQLMSKGHPLEALFAGLAIRHFQQQKELPSTRKAYRALASIPQLVSRVKKERGAANVWSLVLLGLSAFYFLWAFGEKGRDGLKTAIFAMAWISAVFFLVGISAVSMVLVVFLKHPGFPNAVLHYEFRSILGILCELYRTDHWVLGSLLTAFSIVIPLSKLVCTIYALKSTSPTVRTKIGNFLAAIGKWSMADVFVAAVFLSFFALNSEQSTQVGLGRGLYFFLAYCILSLTTTTLLKKETERPNAV